MKLNKVVQAIAGTCLLASSVAANATGLDFIVNEQVVPGVSGNVYGGGGFPGLTSLRVDEMQGSYRELFTVTGPGMFSSIAFAQVNTFIDNSVVIGGVPAPVAPAPYTFLSGSTSAGGDNGSIFTSPYYALYGLFEAVPTRRVVCSPGLRVTSSCGSTRIATPSRRSTRRRKQPRRRGPLSLRVPQMTFGSLSRRISSTAWAIASLASTWCLTALA